MTEPAITFENVRKTYTRHHQVTAGFKSFLFNLPKALREMRQTQFEALKDISFTVARGEALGIVGRNGAGKSTVLGLIAGVLRPTAGRVEVRGRVSPMLELGVGFARDLTGAENIVLKGVLMGWTREEVRRRYDEIVAFSELGEFIDQPVRTYSSGMMARLGFSVVSVLDPEILLIDEVLAVGDIDFRKKCIDKMQSFKKTDVTMVLVSHSMDNVIKVCDRAIWIESKLVRMSGTAHEVVEAYKR
jgi:lipopolysaccharide transport system ATP-binding protein